MKHNLTVIILTIVLGFVHNNVNAAINKILPPDFAYPETVIKASDNQISSYLKSGNEKMALRALVNYTLAQSSIGSENWPATILKIKDTQKALFNQDTKAIANILLANLYLSIYEENKYVYDNRNLPSITSTDDFKEWNGEEFRKIISELCDEAISQAPVLQSKPLADYSDLITIEKNSRVYFPTLYDFVAHQAIKIRQSLSPFSFCVGILSLSPRATFMINPGFAPASAQTQKILDTYASLLAFHKDNIAPEIYCDINRLEYVSQRLYSSFSHASKDLLKKRLLNLYNDYSSSEYSGNVLIALEGLMEEDEKRYYTLLENNIKRFPDFALSGCLKNLRSSLERQEVEMNAPATIAPNKPFKVNLSSRNSNTVTVYVYNVSNKAKAGNDWIEYSTLSSLTPINTIKVDFNNQKIPFEADTTVALTLPDYGYYAIVLHKNIGSGNRRNAFQVTHCTELAASIINRPYEPEIFVINPLTGKPVEGTDIKYFKRSGRNPQTLITGQTDNDGFFNLKETDSGNLQPVKGKDNAAQALNYWKSPQPDDDWTYACNAYTNLAIYHPGDTAEWCSVIYQTKPLENRIANQSDIEVIMYNANSIAVDTLQMTTDDWGRIHGSFAIPKGELTGNYRISFRLKNGKFIGSRNFMVSDYKMPTFYVKLNKAASGLPSTGDVTISGLAKTYSGIPVANAQVKAVISVSTGHWWFRSNETEFTTLTDTTDATGCFELVLSKELIENSPAPDGIFNAVVSVTSLSGESQQSNQDFTTSDRYAITTTLPHIVEVSNPVNLAAYFNVMSSDGSPIETPLEYSLYAKGNTTPVMSGAVDKSVEWSNLKGNTYSMSVKTTSLNADSITINDLIIYRKDDSYSPVKSVIWYPGEHKLDINGHKSTVNIFAETDDTYMLYYLTVPKGETERRWIKLHKGANNIDVNIPHNASSATLTLTAVKDYNTHRQVIELTAKEKQHSLSLITETFRDRLTPGQNETWTFRTLDKDSSGTQAAVILDMYNNALDAIQPAVWSIGFNKGYWHMPYVSAPSFGRIWNNYFADSNSRNTCEEIQSPSLQTYGMTFSPVRKFRTALYGAAAGVTVANEMKLSSAAPKTKVESAADGVENTEEEAALDEVFSIREDAGSASVSEETTKTNENFTYREANVPLAFFAPKLTTDAQGMLSYKFNVPNANTTWSFNALAYGRDLTSAAITRNILANKPIMVQPNLPRFLRSGDKALILSTVTNNSDTCQNIHVEAVPFNPLNNTSIESPLDTTFTLHAGEISSIGYKLKISHGIPFIGFRIKASTESFSDGEQALIPILEASTPVIEPRPFYISPDSTSFDLQLPTFGKEAKVTLQYCDNPTWYVVTALPGISTKEARTAPEAAAAIFSAAVAEGIINTCPQVKQALKEWTRSDHRDSTLVSMLERNSDLKTFLLQATPWMLDASSDTERMQRLALLFDKDNIKSTYSSNIAVLKKLQRSSGGWAWISQYEKTSEWATQQTLEILGRLNELGFLPRDKSLDDMISGALGYVQAQNEKLYRKYPKSDFSNYVFLIDKWPTFKPSLTTKTIINRTVQRYVNGWKKMNLISKASASLLFYRHGYKPLARQVLQSLNQFAKTSPTQGMYWPLLDDFAGGTMTQLALASKSLEAYHLITPDCKEVDLIRQWLILQKEARNWGNSALASNVAASILLTSPRWISTATPAHIYLGDSEIHPSEVEKTLGYFRTDISHMQPSGKKLRIEKSDKTPSWGAVYSQSIEEMQSVRSSSCEAVDIEKRLYKQVGERWEPATTINVGDKVKVELVLKVNRDMDYVAIDDDRAACFEPVDQLPSPMFAEGLCFYRENSDDATNIFISRLPKGTYMLTYELWANNAGTYSSGIATIQSQYAPQLTAHSSGGTITVE